LTTLPPSSVDTAVGTGPGPPSDDRVAAALRGFGPAGILAMLLILFTGNVWVAPMVPVPIGATLVLLWAWLSRTPWREIGYVRPASWLRTIALGIALGSRSRSS
jgi:hypothetical protein